MSITPQERIYSLPEIARIPGSSINSRWERWTSLDAERALENNTGNRNINQRHVARLRKDMRGGLWSLSHQGIAFDDTGVLIDGQHRLAAQVAEKIDCWWLVTRGLPNKAQTVVDGGRKRQASDFANIPNRKLVYSTVRAALAISVSSPEVSSRNISTASGMLTTSELLTELDAESFDKIRRHAPAASAAAKNVALGATALLAASVSVLDSDEKIGEFLSGLVSMTELVNGDPRLALLKLRPPQKAERFSYPDQIMTAVKCAHAWGADRAVRTIHVKSIHDWVYKGPIYV